MQQDAAAAYTVRGTASADATAAYAILGLQSVSADAVAQYIVVGRVSADAVAAWRVGDTNASETLPIDAYIAAYLNPGDAARGTHGNDYLRLGERFARRRGLV